jgi:predicted RNase H-like HicB family nuclease
MQLRGRIYKDGRFWVVECDALKAYTQGTSRKDGLEMMKDWLRGMLDDPKFDFQIFAAKDGDFVMEFTDPRRVLGLVLHQQRNAAGMTLQEVAEKAGVASRSTVAQAEKGSNEISISRLGDLLRVMGIDLVIDIGTPKRAANG